MMEGEINQQLAFIVGRGRSGTSLLSSILNTHPDISVVPEGMFVINLLKKYRATNQWDEKSLDRFYDDLFLDERLAQWWNLDKEAFKGDLLKLKGERTYSSLCRFVYQREAYAAKKKATRFIVDKNNSNSLFIPELIELFPTAKFIHIVRDPRDTVASYKQVPFDANGTIALAQRWKHYNRVILKHSSGFPEKFHLILFENLLSEPMRYLSDLCQFLGIDFNEQLLHFYEKNSYYGNLKEATAEVKTAYQNINKPLDSNQAFKWKQNLEKKDWQEINTVCHKEIAYFGYENGNDKVPLVSRLKFGPGVCFGSLLNFSEKFVYSLPLRLRAGIIHFYRKRTKTI
jgi:hypothetical protein